jgi:GntR family transcriptional regulator
MLDKTSGTPLYAQLADVLRKQVRDNRLPPNTQLPSERELCERHSISRITVRKALDELLHEGLVYTCVGKGTYVAEPKLSEELQPLSSFTEDMQRRGMVASSQVLEAAIVPCDDFLAARLHVPRGAEVINLHRLRLADGLPIAIQRACLPHHLCPDLLQYDFSSRSLLDVLRTEYGLKLAGADTSIEAALARSDEIRLLQLSSPAAVLISEQTTYLDSGVVIEWTRSVFRGDRYRLHTRTR